MNLEWLGYLRDRLDFLGVSFHVAIQEVARVGNGRKAATLWPDDPSSSSASAIPESEQDSLNGRERD
jgi:hypothetical protein